MEVKHELRYLGDFTVNYIMEHQELLLDGQRDWKEIAEIILTEMYKSVKRAIRMDKILCKGKSDGRQ